MLFSRLPHTVDNSSGQASPSSAVANTVGDRYEHVTPPKIDEEDARHFIKPTTSQDSEIAGGSFERQMYRWQPSYLRVAPLCGLLALFLVLLQIIASGAILAASNHKPVDSWKYQPSVYIAILTAISNKAIAFAALQGAVVTFWLKALQGTTLGALHRDWAYGCYMPCPLVWCTILTGALQGCMYTKQ
jgi:hypothetical protein